MTAITITDLNNAKLDVDHIAEIATSGSLTATDRLGQVKPTLLGTEIAIAAKLAHVEAVRAEAIDVTIPAKIAEVESRKVTAITVDIPAAIATVAAINNRGAWAATTTYALKDIVLTGGTWYLCIVAHTSSASFATDTASKWRVYQDASKMAGYADLRAYSGDAATASITNSGVAGDFIRSITDTTSADNGGTVIVDAAGRRWLRNFSSNINVRWFGADATGATNATAAFTAAGSVTGYSEVVVPPGTYLLNTVPTPSQNVTWLIDNSALLTGTGGSLMGGTAGAGQYLLQSKTTGADYAAMTVRRNANHTGGTPGNVSSAIKAYTYTSANVANFEWAITGVVDNSATVGQNVGIYGQGIKRSTGPTWGMVAEAIDVVGTNNPPNGLVGIEVDCRGNGTDNFNNRIGIDIVINKQNPAGLDTEVGFGIRIQNGGDSNAVVKTALGVVCKAQIGLDLANATIYQVGIRLAQTQAIAFNASMLNKIQYDGTGINYIVNSVGKIRLNDDGSILLNSRLLLKGIGFSTGSNTPTMGANKPGSVGGAPSTWMPVVIDGTSYWTPLWAN